MYSPRILPGECNSEEPTAPHICQTRTAADFGYSKVLVRRWHLQASTTSLQTARNHQRLCYIRRVRETSAAGICPYVKQERKGL